MTIKEKIGVVVSTKMNKTIVIQVNDFVLHKTYEKILTKTKRFLAHDEYNECSIGDVVLIKGVRPLSKRKHWKLIQILNKNKNF